jgi:hypothetical protein
VATDGLFAYAGQGTIVDHLRATPFDECAETVARLARLPSGTLMDDLMVLLCEQE